MPSTRISSDSSGPRSTASPGRSRACTPRASPSATHSRKAPGLCRGRCSPTPCVAGTRHWPDRGSGTGPTALSLESLPSGATQHSAISATIDRFSGLRGRERAAMAGDGGAGVIGALAESDPAEVGGYRLLGRLGAGGMGTVFLGVSPGARLAAVKLVHPEYGADPSF